MDAKRAAACLALVVALAQGCNTAPNEIPVYDVETLEVVGVKDVDTGTYLFDDGTEIRADQYESRFLEIDELSPEELELVEQVIASRHGPETESPIGRRTAALHSERVMFSPISGCIAIDESWDGGRCGYTCWICDFGSSGFENCTTYPC